LRSRKLIRAYRWIPWFHRRRRTCKAAISIGELLRSDDPVISEWGNPYTVMGVDSVMNSIVTVEQTR
jgi:hypothetical protein